MSYLRQERFDPLLLIDHGEAVNMESACKLAQKMRNERRNQLLKSHADEIDSLKSWNVYYLSIYWKEA